jgi:CDP-diacylglycerol--serine O-phosphatidyltransferase
LAGIALFGAALLVAPWTTLLALSVVYLLMIPVAMLSYARVTRRRATPASRARAGPEAAPGPASTEG